MPNRPCHRAYDHRIRDLVCEERNPALFAQLGIPRSTAASWIRRGSRPVVTTELFARNEQQLRVQVLKLERRVQLLPGIVRLLFVLVRRFGFRLDSQRVPSGEAKSCVLGAIERAKNRIALAVALRALGLSASRYHAWLRLDRACSLDDRTSCPRTIPGQLTRREVATIQPMVTAEAYRHIPLGSLALLAQRLGTVFASATTWARLVKERGWRRPRQRVHPAKPKIGIRASRPNEIWHIDALPSPSNEHVPDWTASPPTVPSPAPTASSRLAIIRPTRAAPTLLGRYHGADRQPWDFADDAFAYREVWNVVTRSSAGRMRAAAVAVIHRPAVCHRCWRSLAGSL